MGGHIDRLVFQSRHTITRKNSAPLDIPLTESLANAATQKTPRAEVKNNGRLVISEINKLDFLHSGLISQFTSRPINKAPQENRPRTIIIVVYIAATGIPRVSLGSSGLSGVPEMA